MPESIWGMVPRGGLGAQHRCWRVEGRRKPLLLLIRASTKRHWSHSHPTPFRLRSYVFVRSSTAKV